MTQVGIAKIAKNARIAKIENREVLILNGLAKSHRSANTKPKHYVDLTNTVFIPTAKKRKVPPGLRFAKTSRDDGQINTLFPKLALLTLTHAGSAFLEH